MEKEMLEGKVIEKHVAIVKRYKGNAGSVLLFKNTSTTYRFGHECEEEMFKVLAFLQTRKDQEIEKIEVHSTNECYLIEVSNGQDEIFYGYADMKAAIFNNEYYLDMMTGIRISTDDIRFEYEIIQKQLPYQQGEIVPLGGIAL